MRIQLQNVALRTLVLVSMALLSAPILASGNDPLLWPEPERAFLQDGPGFLLTQEEREKVTALAADERTRYIAELLDRDPIPESDINELRAGIEARRRLVETEQEWSRDIRPRLLFLNGRPEKRERIECSNVFRPIEIWSYPAPGTGKKKIELVLFEPEPGRPWQMWLPSVHAKGDLIQDVFKYYLEQWEASHGKVFNAERFDFQVCRGPADRMDKATGVRVLTERFRKPLPASHFGQLLKPPVDLAEWSRIAMATELDRAPPELALESVELQFPSMHGQRIVSRLVLMLPPEAGYVVDSEADPPEVKLVAEVLIEQDGRPFETHVSRFVLPAPKENHPLPIVLERPFRPGKHFLLRLRLSDEIGGAELRLSKAIIVPRLPEKVEEVPLTEEVLVELGESLAQTAIEGADSLLLVPPAEDVVIGLWRAEALVSGSRISKVAFLVDGEPQLRRNRKPWAAELRLPSLPVELIIRAEGYDPSGELVASDELVLNQPRGMLRVRIVEPRRDVAVKLPVEVKVEVTLPEGRTIDRVEFTVDGSVVATDTRPPWEASVGESGDSSVPTYLSVAAFLDDGRRAEDLRFLGIDAFTEEVHVQLVELYTAVMDSSGRMVRDLGIADFEVLEDGRKQKLEKLELVENLPLTVGIVMDTSTSMESRIEAAKAAASSFLEQVIRKGDRAFAVAFADRASLLTPPTGDAKAVSLLIGRQKAYGWTALHDALLTSLFYFRGYRGQRALILLSDGDDSASAVGFKEALEYARRSGVAVYPIGIDISKIDVEVRHKLKKLAEVTGGRHFFVTDAEELAEVYQDIELELRSRYLLTYVPILTGGDDAFREIEVKVRRRGLETRTIRGYYP